MIGWATKKTTRNKIWVKCLRDSGQNVLQSNPNKREVTPIVLLDTLDYLYYVA